MKNIIFIILIMLQSLTIITAQSNIQIGNDKNIVVPRWHWKNKVFTGGYALVMDATTELYGFANSSGDVKIPCIYGMVKDFSEEMAAVMDKQTEKWGYINRQGDTIIPFLYDDASRFGYNSFGDIAFPGLAYVNIGISNERRQRWFTDGKWGLINRKGEEVLPVKYGYISWVSDGCAAIYEGEIIIQHLSEHTDTTLFPGKLGFINSLGEIIIPPQYDFDIESIFIDGVAKVKKDGKSFLINKKGKKVKRK